MISLDRLLGGLSVSVDGVVFSNFRRGPPRDGPTEHFTVRFAETGGGATIELVGGALIRFESAAVTVVPARTRARAERPSAARAAAGRNGPPAVRSEHGENGRGGATGRWRATYLGSLGLFDQLREPLVERLRRGDPLARSFRELLDEVASQRPGRRAMLEVLFGRSVILFLRRCCADEGGATWMAAIEDAGLSRAVAVMRDHPERTFTIQRLAEVAGMSRSVFAARFTTSLDRPPMEFLKEIRLALAARLLTRTDLPVKAVAARVGYSSRSAFARAFQASHRVGPAAFRLDERDPSPAETPRSSSRRGLERRKGERRRSAGGGRIPRRPRR
jgi:AraC-like DNA-binding protein